MRRSRRDAQTDAEGAEAYAERVDTSDAWLVAADAWEIAGQPDRARFAILRQSVKAITRAKAQRIRQQLQEGDRQMREGTPYEKSATNRLTSDEISNLDVYDFLLDPPERLTTAYSNAAGEIVTFTGQVLGHIVRRGQRFYGRLPSRHVSVHAINGFAYSGTCNLDEDLGTYCKLKRGKAWLRR